MGVHDIAYYENKGPCRHCGERLPAQGQDKDAHFEERTKTNEGVWSLALETFGQEPQLSMLQEEAGELIADVNRWRRQRISDDKLASEVADVLIMCEQISLLLDPAKVRHQLQLKTNRLRERLAKKLGVTDFSRRAVE